MRKPNNVRNIIMRSERAMKIAGERKGRKE